MTKQTIDNLQPGTLDGDSLFRTAEKINENFNEIYSHFGDGRNLDDGYAGLKGLNAGLIASAGAGGYNVREIVAGSTAVSITNGTGGAGNPTIDLPDTGVLSAGSSATVFADVGLTVDVKGRIVSISTPTLLTSAQTQSANAASSATAAATSATASATSATASAASATSAANDVAAIGTSLADAATHATNAGNSATAAATSETNAATSATTATTQAGLATTNGQAQVTLATAQVALATTQAGNASTSATNASNSASAAATSETNAANSATAAATSATNAAASLASMGSNVTQAQTAATNAANSFDAFDDIFLGAKSSAPTVDNDGDALQTGALYFNTTSDKMFVRTSGGSWTAAGSAVNGTTDRSSYVATANQTTFSATYDVGYLDVYLNGIKLSAADFTANNGTSFVLASGASVGDQVDAIGYGAFNVANVYTKTEADTLLAAKATTADLTTTNTTVGTKAPLASPAFTGSPTVNGLAIATNTDLALKAPLASPALTGSPTVNGQPIATGSTELGTLTQAFSAGQQTTINLSANALSPSVAVTKEVPQVGITNNQWNVNSSSPNYTRYNSAPATTLDFVGYDLGSASFKKSFSVNAQEIGVLGLTFNADGTKMYVIGDNGDDVNQYALSTAWDIATASYEKVKDISSEETVPQSVRFSTDGTRMFIAGDSWNAIFQYNLSTGFDVGTASYSNNTFSVASQDSAPQGLAFNNDGTKMFVVGQSSNTIYQYTLTTGWDLSTASYASVSLLVGPQDSTPKGMTFNSDGTKMYVAGQQNSKIYYYSLSTGFDISSASYQSALTVSSQNASPTDVAFDSSGSNLYMLGESGNIVYQYDLPLNLTLGSGSFAAADVAKTIEANNGKFILTATSGTFSTTTAPSNYNQVASGSWQMYGTNFDTVATDLELSHTFLNAYANGVFSYTDNSGLGNSISEPQGLCFGNNGTKFYIMCSNQQKIYEFNLSTAFDVTTRSLVNSFSTSSNFTQGSDFIITPDGTRIFLTQTQGGRIDTYELTTPFDITTCSNFAMVRNMNSTDGESTPTGICFSPDGTNMYVVGTGLNRCYHLSLSTGYDPSSTIAMVSETSIGAIDPTAITMKPDGTRFFIYSDSANAVKIYDTSTAFSFSSASYTTQYTATNANSGRGLAFNDTGSQLNIIDTAADYIYRYDTATLSAPSGYHAAHTTTSIDSTYWTDINSMTANETAGSGTVNYAVSTDDRTTWKIAHNTNGARNIVKNNSGTWQYNSNGTYGSETWVNGSTNNELATLQQAMEGASLATNAYALSNASAGYGAVFSVASYQTEPRDIKFNADGSKMFTTGRTVDAVVEWHLSTNFDTSTAVYDSNFSVYNQEQNPQALAFKPDGTKMYVAGPQEGKLQEYNLSTAFDVSTATYVQGFAVFNQVGSPEGIAFNSNGTKVFITGPSGAGVREYSLSTAYDVSTMSYTQQFSTSSQNNDVTGIAFNSDGTEMYLGFSPSSFARVYKYTLSTGFDISTASVSTYVDLGSYNTKIRGITFTTDGTKLFTIDSDQDRVSQFTLGSSSFTNQMNKTQLDAVSDANQFAVSDDLDLAIILNLSSGSGIPSSDGVSINYDAAVANQGAILGTDYNYDVPALNKVRITAVNAATLKVRVV